MQDTDRLLRDMLENFVGKSGFTGARASANADKKSFRIHTRIEYLSALSLNVHKVKNLYNNKEHRKSYKVEMSHRVVSVFNIPSRSLASEMQHQAMTEFSCTGIEEYSLDEAQVDELLGMRSYSGGDLPEEVLSEVDQRVLTHSFHQKFYFDSELSQDFFDHVKTNFLCEVEHSIIQDTDWNSEWKKHYSPIHVSESFSVLPEWEDARSLKEKGFVKIHPGMGFGTGSHETTHLCLKSFLDLEAQLSEESTFLDYGSGSGILGLAALIRLPKTTCVMVDIDQEAHDNCLQNMELNHITQSRVEMLFVKDRPTKKFNLVFANILRNILFQESNYLIQSVQAGGYLILSGLLENQLEETLEHYLKSGHCHHVKTEVKGDWGAIVLRKVE